MPHVDHPVRQITFGGLIGTCGAYCPVCRTCVAVMDDFGLEIERCVHLLTVGHDDGGEWSNRAHWIYVDDLPDAVANTLAEGEEWWAKSDEARAIADGAWVAVRCQWDTEGGPFGSSWTCTVAWPIVGDPAGLEAEIEASVARIQAFDPHGEEDEEYEEDDGEE
jgi:hypothetical protein